MYAVQHSELKSWSYIGIVNGAYISEPPQFIENAIETFSTLREAAGPNTEIAVDFHGRTSVLLARKLIKALEPFDPMWVEEPVQFDDVAALASLQEGTTIPIATGERLVTRWQFDAIIAARAVEIIQPVRYTVACLPSFFTRWMNEVNAHVWRLTLADIIGDRTSSLLAGSGSCARSPLRRRRAIFRLHPIVRTDPSPWSLRFTSTPLLQTF
jgi:hypothetical protein